MIKPLNNHCLIEIIDEYEGVVRNSSAEDVQKGVLRDVAFTPFHLTASTGFDLAQYTKAEVQEDIRRNINKTVYWQEYADTGNKLKFDGKQYVMVPFYRLIGFEE